MDTTKLRIALDDMLEQRERMDKAIESLRAVIEDEEGHKVNSRSTPAPRRSEASEAYLDLAVTFLERRGKPARMKEILHYVRQIKGSAVHRNSLEATLARHVRSKGTGARLIKLGRGVWGLPVHAQKPLQLAVNQ